MKLNWESLNSLLGTYLPWIYYCLGFSRFCSLKLVLKSGINLTIHLTLHRNNEFWGRIAYKSSDYKSAALPTELHQLFLKIHKITFFWNRLIIPKSSGLLFQLLVRHSETKTDLSRRSETEREATPAYFKNTNLL